MVAAPIQRQQESWIWGAVKKEILFSANSSSVIQMAMEELNSIMAQL